MRVRVYGYNDIRAYTSATNRPAKVKSNLCSWYYLGKGKFCGNYCSRRGRHGDTFNRRCWRHRRRGGYSASLPPVVLLMISASDRTYNRELWIKFLQNCESSGTPFELVIYHEDMLKCTVRDPQNLLSRFRPFPDQFGSVVLPLKNHHGSLNFTQTCLKMLEYGTKIPHAARCIVLTERTIPIRPPVEIYKRAISSKCYLDTSYNVGYGPTPTGVEGRRGKPFAGVNNHCQGLYTTEFLRLALPTVPLQCGKFGITLGENSVYTISDGHLFEMWRTFTGSNPSEFLLLNSFLLNSSAERPIQQLKQYMEKTVENDQHVVAEVPQWRGGWKRTYVFRDLDTRELIPRFDTRSTRYYQGLSLSTQGVSLLEIVRYVRRNKKRALFFRQVELP